MQKHTEITQERCLRFAEKISSLFYSARAPLHLEVFSSNDRITYAEALRGDYIPTETGRKFGPAWSSHWFRIQGEIPTGWQDGEVHFLWDSSSEALIWWDGKPVQGLTGSASSWANDGLRIEYRLPNHVLAEGKFSFFVEMACNGLFGLDSGEYTDRIGTLLQAEIGLFNRPAWDLYWDLKVIADMARYLQANSPRAGQALYTANAMVNLIHLDDPSTWNDARALASNFLSERNGMGQHNLSAVGHAHIDTAWLWPIAETRRKCARTFASALRYMEDYPDYLFVSSQAQQYAWIKEYYPDLYERLRDKVRQGRFIPVGGTWVEPDCNIPSGESLVRQFLFGQRFFQHEFGIHCREFWNPDVFGYSGALPQIMRQAGIDYFLTQKLSWNQFNKPAHHSFIWEGIDGSQVLTHFPPADTYNSVASVKEILFNLENFKDHDRSKESYLLFGFGDGGGGPTPAMLEQINRIKDVDGLPRVEIRSPEEFFQRCAADLKDPSIWVGELYFELHRGTYTSQARTKRYNRQSEILLHDIELLAALNFAQHQEDYPTEEINVLWKSVLTNQFHDIIPGSSIREVYEDSCTAFATVARTGRARRSALLEKWGAETSGDRLFAFNTLCMPRNEVVELPEGMLGRQETLDGKALSVVKVPPIGYSIAQVEMDTMLRVWVSQKEDLFTLENEFVQAVFNQQGRLFTFLDKRLNRSCLAPEAPANRFMMYEDEPLNWDAWDVDIFHLEKPLDYPCAHAAQIIESGPLRAAIKFEYALSPRSYLAQVVYLTAISPRLDFATDVMWAEKHKFLKVDFPVNVRASQAAYEIQFGHLYRPTHFNTSWDLARFEVCAHKWADLSEPGFGVALINDSKYGHAVHGNTMRLSLLRSPTNPDPNADEGSHQFRYALLPHSGSLQDANVIQEGYKFNVPVLLARCYDHPTECSFFQVDNPAIILETVKKAEDSTALILRLYEAHGGHGTATLSSPLPIRSAFMCNLLEEEIHQLNWQNQKIQIEFTPFQIVTLKLNL